MISSPKFGNLQQTFHLPSLFGNKLRLWIYIFLLIVHCLSELDCSSPPSNNLPRVFEKSSEKSFIFLTTRRVCQFWLRLIIKFANVSNPITRPIVDFLSERFFRKNISHRHWALCEQRLRHLRPERENQIQVIKFSFIRSRRAKGK